MALTHVYILFTMAYRKIEHDCLFHIYRRFMRISLRRCHKRNIKMNENEE